MGNRVFAKYKKRPTSVSLPPKVIQKLDFIASKNLFPSRSSLICHYIMEGFKREKLFFDWLGETEDYKQEPVIAAEGCLVDRQEKQVFLGNDWNMKRLVKNV